MIKSCLPKLRVLYVPKVFHQLALSSNPGWLDELKGERPWKLDVVPLLFDKRWYDGFPGTKKKIWDLRGSNTRP